MKQVCQIDAAGYFTGLTTADESPLEPGVYLLPAGAVNTAAPVVPEGKRARWDGIWVFENMPQSESLELTYAQKRALEYPSFTDYLDGIVKNNQAQIDKYIADCLAVKAKYPKT